MKNHSRVLIVTLWSRTGAQAEIFHAQEGAGFSMISAYWQ